MTLLLMDPDSLNQEAQNAMEIAINNFCLIHHSKYELEIISKVISHFNNLHLYYQIHGLLLNNFVLYAHENKNHEYLAKLESELWVYSNN